MCIFPVKCKWGAGTGHNCRTLRIAKRLIQILKRKAIKPKSNKQKGDVKAKRGDFASCWAYFTVTKAGISSGISDQRF